MVRSANIICCALLVSTLILLRSLSEGTRQGLARQARGSSSLKQLMFRYHALQTRSADSSSSDSPSSDDDEEPVVSRQQNIDEEGSDEAGGKEIATTPPAPPTVVTTQAPTTRPPPVTTQRPTTSTTTSPTSPPVVTTCVDVQQCTDVDLLQNVSSSYDSSLSLSAELLEGTICQAQRDLTSGEAPRCATVRSQDSDTLILDVNPSSRPTSSTLTLQVADSMANPLVLMSAVYEGVELAGLGQYRIEQDYAPDGSTVTAVRRFLRVPGATEFLPFPLIEQRCTSRSTCGEGVQPSPPLPHTNPPTLLPSSVTVPNPTEAQFRAGATELFITHCSCL